MQLMVNKRGSFATFALAFNFVASGVAFGVFIEIFNCDNDISDVFPFWITKELNREKQ